MWPNWFLLEPSPAYQELNLSSSLCRTSATPGYSANLDSSDNQIIADDKLAFLEKIIDPGKGVKADFSSERKSAIYLTKALQSAANCEICGARVHKNSISIDHINAKRDGGRASEDNGRLTHPFCNSARDAIAKERELIAMSAK